MRFLVAPICLICSLAIHLSAPAADFQPSNEVTKAISRGEAFLTNLFDATVDLLPEYQGARVYWLYHDNYLAEKLLTARHPALAERIRMSIHRFGARRSGKIEILFDEIGDAFPFHTYELLVVTNVNGKIIRTERITEKLLKGWDEYADLLLMAAIARSKTHPLEAQADFKKALAMWDGNGFADPASRKHNLYATYKLALGMIAANRLKANLPFQSDVLSQLRKLQSESGGWITDYDRQGRPHGLANVETTCMVLLALKSF